MARACSFSVAETCLTGVTGSISMMNHAREAMPLSAVVSLVQRVSFPTFSRASISGFSGLTVR